MDHELDGSRYESSTLWIDVSTAGVALLVMTASTATDTVVVVAPEVGEISGNETIPIIDEDDHGHEHGPMQWIRRCSSSFNLCMHRQS